MGHSRTNPVYATRTGAQGLEMENEHSGEDIFNSRAWEILSGRRKSLLQPPALVGEACAEVV